jgi:diguanylate cyclase (GGDEF)-like protein
MSLRTHLEQRSRPFKALLGLSLIAVVGLLDLVTGYELSFSLFYVLPIVLVTWLLGRWSGLIAAFASALVWLWADMATGHVYSHPLIPFWNTLIRLAFFVIITLLLFKLRKAMEHEQALARTDDLTGAFNSRHFFAVAQAELERQRRYGRPFTVVYIDLDDFKTVNDQLGHAAGDRVLRCIVDYAHGHLRALDVFARLGGDEFAALLPETDATAARVVVAKLRDGLLDECCKTKVPVTVSMGALTCNAAPATTDEMVRLADDLMYAVKRAGKNGVSYAAYGELSAAGR